jgi:peroxiredoxin
MGMIHQRRGLTLLAGIVVGLLFGLGLILGSSGLDLGVEADRSDPERAAARAIQDSSNPAAAATSTLEPAPVIGAPAPDFELVNLQGEPITLSELRGGVVLLNFWATWCGPCRVEMPTLQDKYDELREAGFMVLGVNFDESHEAVRASREELGLSFPLLLDPGGRVQRLYNIRGYPSTVIVDEQGVIRIIHIGIITEGQLEGYLVQVDLQS